MVRFLLKIGMLPALAGFAWAACAQATGSVSLQKERVEGLSGDVLQVTHCGSWRKGDKFGDRRLVLMRVYGGAGTEVYVQWLSAPDQNTMEIRPVRTIGIDELNNDHSQYFFSQATCSGGQSSSSIVLRGTYEHDERPKTHVFNIAVHDTGRYVIRKR